MSRTAPRLGLLALLLSLATAAPVTARPPDLPVDPDAQCKPQMKCPLLAEPAFKECQDFDFIPARATECPPTEENALTRWWNSLHEVIVSWFPTHQTFVRAYVPVETVTLPQPSYLLHPPQYYPPTPAFPVDQELSNLEKAWVARAAGAGCPAERAHIRMRARISRIVQAVPVPEMPKEVAENLRQLTQARRVFQMGERYQHQGEFDLARACYQECHLLFPTCTYGVVSLQRIAQMLAVRRAVEDAEEAERRDDESDDEGSDEARDQRSKFRMAVDLYTIGERCWQKGDLDKAFACFDEVVQVCPKSDIGQNARRKWTVIRALREVTAPASEPSPETPTEQPEPAELPNDSSRLQPEHPQIEAQTFRAIERLYSLMERVAPIKIEINEESATRGVCVPPPAVGTCSRPRRVCLGCREEQPTGEGWLSGRALGAAAGTAIGSATGRTAPVGRTQVRFVQPSGMKVTWYTTGCDGKGVYSDVPIETPGRYNFRQAAIYRLKLASIEGHPGLEVYPTLEVVPGNAKTEAFLAHSSVSVNFTAEDFCQIASGTYVVKVIYLPDPQNSCTEACWPTCTGECAPQVIVSTHLESGADPIAEARRRGSILLIVRLGNVDQEVPYAPNLDADDTSAEARKLERCLEGFQRALSLNGPVEVDFDCSRPDTVRFRGTVWLGLFNFTVQGERTPCSSKTSFGVSVLP